MATGMIKALKNGVGFITPDGGGGDLFFHHSELQGVRFENLQEGDTVEYQLGRSRRGDPAAVKVRRSAQVQSGAARAEYRFHNPYNFVQFLPAPTNTGDPLLGRCMPPPHDRYLGLSGRITCTLKAVTPIFVADAKGIEGTGHKSYRFFRCDEQPAIPASTLRGVVRSVFEAITNSCMIASADSRLSKHVSTQEAPRLWPARVERDAEGKWWLQILNGEAAFRASGPDPGEIQPAAWVMRYDYNKLAPSASLRYGINSATYGARPVLSIPDGIEHGTRCWALIKRMYRPDKERPRPDGTSNVQNGFWFWNVIKLAKTKEELQARAEQRRVEGYLCLNNHNIEAKHDERFFFSTDEEPRRIPLDDPTRRDYEDLIQDYQRRHADTIRRCQRQDHDPSQPWGKKAAFSRFILATHHKLRPDDLVYVRLHGPDDTPTVKFIAPVAVPRIMYRKTVSQLLPGTVKPCDKYHDLCPACRVFGWVHRAGEDVPLTQRVAYAGRLRFTHATLTNTPQRLTVSLAILSAPKPTQVLFYLKPNGPDLPARWTDSAASDGFDGANNELRGRKFYLHHPKLSAPDYEHKGENGDQNRTVRDALDEDATFKFEIAFDNLAPLELGALLWAIEMDGQGFHRLGCAKPLGFGSVELRVESAMLIDVAERLRSLTVTGEKPLDEDQRADLVKKFRDALAQRYGEDDFEALQNVHDLRSILAGPHDDLPIHYPRVPTAKGENFKWFVGNNRAPNRYTLPLPDDQEGLPLFDDKGRRVR